MNDFNIHVNVHVDSSLKNYWIYHNKNVTISLVVCNTLCYLSTPV